MICFNAVLATKLSTSRMANCMPSFTMVCLGNFNSSGAKDRAQTVSRNPGLPAEAVNRVKVRPVISATLSVRSAVEKNISTPDITVANRSRAIYPGTFLIRKELVSIVGHDENCGEVVYQRITPSK